MVFILEQTIQEMQERYSNFANLMEDIHRFILEFDVNRKEKKIIGELEQKVDPRKPEETTTDSTTKNKDSAINKTSKIKPQKKVESTKKPDKENNRITVKYSHSKEEEQSLAETFYASNIDYNQLFSYGLKMTNKPKNDYERPESEIIKEQKTETMSDKEAEKMLVSIQYATVTGAMNDLSYEERRRFSTWVDFNPALWRLFHTNYAFTADVNYSNSF